MPAVWLLEPGDHDPIENTTWFKIALAHKNTNIDISGYAMMTH